jgi:hypothetical protein
MNPSLIAGDTLRQVYLALGMASAFELRETALKSEAEWGPLSPEFVRDFDLLVLTGQAQNLALQCQQLTAAINSEGVAFNDQLLTTLNTLNAEPANAAQHTPVLFAQLDQFNARLQQWKPQVQQMEQPAHRWALRVCDDGDAALLGLQQQLQRTVGDFHTFIDDYHRTEIARQHTYAAKNQLRINQDPPSQDPAGKVPKNDEEVPKDHRDWQTIYLPGVRLVRWPVNYAKLEKRTPQTPEDTRAIVAHTGGINTKNTVRAFDDRGRPEDQGGKGEDEGSSSHVVVEPNGELSQLLPQGFSGLHAEDASKLSLGVDLAYGTKYREATAQFAFLENTAQMVTFLRLIHLQERISPQVADPKVHYKELTLAEQANNICGFRKGNPETITVCSPPKYRESIKGVMAHEDNAQTTHSDPGPLYMQRIYTMRPLIVAYERRYGAIDIKNPQELEKLLHVIDAYEKQTGEALAPISEAEILQALGDPSKQQDEDDLDKLWNARLSSLAIQHYGSQAKFEDAVAQEKENIRQSMKDIDLSIFWGSEIDYEVLKAYIPDSKYSEVSSITNVNQFKADYQKPKIKTKIDTFRTSLGSQIKEKTLKAFADNIAKDIVKQKVYADQLELSVEKFRNYLEENLPELLAHSAMTQGDAP